MASDIGTISEPNLMKDGYNGYKSVLKTITESVSDHEGLLKNVDVHELTPEIDAEMKELENVLRGHLKSLQTIFETAQEKSGLKSHSDPPKQPQQKEDDKNYNKTKSTQEINELKKQLKEKDKQLNKVTKEFEDMKNKFKKTQKQTNPSKAAVRILRQQEGGLFDEIYQEFRSKLKGRLKAMQVELKECRDSHSETNQPLLIVCFSSTRVSSDVDIATKDLQDSDGNIMLLIFHHAEIHTNIVSSSHLQNEFQRFSGITDFRFFSGKGIYPCDMNNMSMDKIVHFIETYAIPNQKSRP